MLHIIKHYRYLSDAIAYSMPSDSILLVEDAVYAALPSHKAHPLFLTSLCQVYVLKEDLTARGLPQDSGEILRSVDFAGFVDLTAENNQSMTWC